MDLVAARLPSVVALAASALALAAIARRLASERAALLAGGLVLATPLAVHAGTIARLDASFSAFVVAADLGALLALRADRPVPSLSGGALAGASLGLSLLVKGPLALALFAFFLVAVLAGGHAPRPRLAAAAAWAAALALVLGGFVAGAGRAQVSALLFQHDVVTGVDEHARSPVYYLGVFPAGLGLVLPLFLVALLGAARRGRAGLRDPGLAVTLAGLVLLSLVPGKRAHYLVPLWPFAALAAALLVERALDGRACALETKLLAIWSRSLPWLLALAGVALGAFAVARDLVLLPFAVGLAAAAVVGMRQELLRSCVATILATAVATNAWHARGAEHVIPRSDAPAIGAAIRALPREVPLGLAFEGDPEATFFGDRPYRAFQGRFEGELGAWLEAHPDAALVLPPGRVASLQGRRRLEELARGSVRRRELVLVRVRRAD